MAYCANSDLVKIRANILSLGVTDWADQIAEADSIINRALETRWYRQACREYELDYREYQFDATLLLNADTQLKRLGTYKTLQLAYIYLANETPNPDAFERQAKNFEKLYSTELADVLAQGVDYDWDESGALYYTEKRMPSMRRLKRV